MSSAETSAVSEILSSVGPDTRHQRWSYDTWDKWSASRSGQALRVDDDELVRFLADHRRRWAGASMWGVAAGICRQATKLGSPAALTCDVRQLIGWVTRIDGGSIGDRPPPLLPGLARDVIADLVVPVVDVECLVHLVALRKGVEFERLPHVEGVHVRAHRSGWRVDAGDVSFALKRADPVDAIAGRLGVQLAARPASSRQTRLCRIRTVLRRAGLDATRISADKLGRYIRELDTDDYEWLVRWCDRSFAIRLRDRALLGIGVGAARRGTDLTRLDRSDIVVTDLGYLCTFRQHKSAMDGERPIGLTIAHIDHLAGGQSDDCPACALADWLVVLDRRWPHLPMVFPTMRGHTAANARLQTGGIGYVIRRSVARVHADPEQFVVRSLRRGGATGAYQGGCDVETIASELTGHAGVDDTVKYIQIDLDYQHPL